MCFSMSQCSDLRKLKSSYESIRCLHVCSTLVFPTMIKGKPTPLGVMLLAFVFCLYNGCVCKKEKSISLCVMSDCVVLVCCNGGFFMVQSHHITSHHSRYLQSLQALVVSSYPSTWIYDPRY